MQFAYRYWLFVLPTAAVCFVLALQLLSPFKALELAYEDLLVTHPVSASQPSNDIVLLTVTEDTLAEFAYRSPFDRGYLAEIVAKLSRANARSIGIDILFDQKTEPKKDLALKSAFNNAAKILVVASATGEEGLSEKQLAFQTNFLAGLNTANILLAKNSHDGIVRHVLSGRLQGGRFAPNLARAMSGDVSTPSLVEPERIYYQSDDEAEPHQFQTYPAEAAELLPDKWFEDKYVLIGMSLPGIDQFRTPFVNRAGEAIGTLPGVMIQANILNQHLLNLRVSETSNVIKLLTIVAAAVLGAVLVLMEISIVLRLLLALAALAAIVVVPYLLFPQTHTLVPAISIAASFFVAVLIGILVRWREERYQRKFVTSAWSHYVSPGIVDELLTNPAQLETGSERRDITLIFTDITNFTSLVENTPIDGLTSILNRYLDRMSTEFLDAGATLDKFVGDAIVGFFGAPIADTNHPDNAVALALKLDEICHKFQEELLLEGINFGRTRIGVHSGLAVVGNFGGSRFFDYTAVGDAVNTAARLESANKVWGGTICVSEDTSRRATGHEFRPIGQVHLAGKSKLIDTWEPLSVDQSGLVPLKDYKKAYRKLEQEDRNSVNLFEELNRSYPKDHLVSFHLERLKNGVRGTIIEVSK